MLVNPFPVVVVIIIIVVVKLCRENVTTFDDVTSRASQIFVERRFVRPRSVERQGVAASRLPVIEAGGVELKN